MQDNKTAVVCGYGDLGKAVAKKLSEQGYLVVVISRSPASGSNHAFFKCDITDQKLVVKTIASVIEKMGGIDVFVHTAISEIQRKNILDLSGEDIKKDFETNVFGSFNILTEVGRAMKEKKKGAIVAVTSAVTEPNMAHGKMGGYLSAKYALKGMLRQMAGELAPHGVTVNAVAPGFMRTKLNQDIPGRMDDFLKEKNPMKRMVTPEEVADLVVFLSSESATHLTGLSIPVTSGETLQL